MNWKSVLGIVAGAALFVVVAVVVHEARKPPPNRSKHDGRTPLTDVARGNQGALGPILPLEAPAAPSGSQPEAIPAPEYPPDEMPDPANPPRWIPPLAEPGPPVPPDPFTPPPMEVDPDRGRRIDAGP